MLRGLTERLYIFDCHSAISYRRVSYYTAMKDNILSFHMNPKYLDIIDKIRHFQADGPFKQQSPRMGYGGLICSKALQSDRPKWGGMYADPRWTSLCKTVSKTMLEWGENRRCLSLSACHLVVSLSRACYHTSYERGHSGLPADMKIRTIVQLIGILWSYFGVRLGSANSPLYFACHSSTSWHILGYHISDERGHP